jgi:hypothetical protein
VKATERSFTNLLLAFRQAKIALARERETVGLFALADYELALASNLRRLGASLQARPWFAAVSVGQLVVMPKPTVEEQPDTANKPIVIGPQPQHSNKLAVRLQLEPTCDFAIVEILYLWRFGKVLEALLTDNCVGYRLKRNKDGEIDLFGREIFGHWQTAFNAYRDDPIRDAKRAITSGEHVVVVSTDISTFFDSVDPSFLTRPQFVARLETASAAEELEFDSAEFLVATKTLLRAFDDFRGLRRTCAADVDTTLGVPIGALTSRLIANLALAGTDAQIASLPGVRLYRRYVDDIIVVTERAAHQPPTGNAAVLGRLFNEAVQDDSGTTFRDPLTGCSFALNAKKTRVHDLYGKPGIDFLAAVQNPFQVVSSEMRAFLADLGRLDGSEDAIELFGDTAALRRVPRLRDADRFTLRRFKAAQLVNALQTAAVLLDRSEAQRLLAKHANRLLAVMAPHRIEDFEFVLSLMRVAILCRHDGLVMRLRQELELRMEMATAGAVRYQWRSTWLNGELTAAELRNYLARRVREEAAKVGSLDAATSNLEALKLRATDLRRLDREDDLQVWGFVDKSAKAVASQSHLVDRRARRAKGLAARIQWAQRFIDVSAELDEVIWKHVTATTLFLSLRPPSYADIAHRFLERATRTKFKPGIGKTIERCVNALRGTQYEAENLRVTASRKAFVMLRVGTARTPTRTRVVLANLSVSKKCFIGAASGVPVLTWARLRRLDRALRDGRRRAKVVPTDVSSVLVLPELSVPRKWERALANWGARSRLCIIAGLEYKDANPGLLNQALGIFPTGWNRAIPIRWTKRHAAAEERALLEKMTPPRELVPLKRTQRIIVESDAGRASVLICSEMLEAPALAALRGKVELLFVPAWNSDTGSFDHVSHAVSSLLLHAFVCIANNAEGSDTRIVAPVKHPRHLREWCRIVLRSATQVIWGDLPVKLLRDIHDRKATGGNIEFRPLPPGWK